MLVARRARTLGVLTEAVEYRGSEQLASLRTAAVMSGAVAASGRAF